MNLSAKIEALLFWKAEPISIKKLAELLEEEQSAVVGALDELSLSLKDRGITLVKTDDEVMLGTSKDASGLIEKITKEELSKDLGKAGLETISIILYQGPVSRAEIDYIRGVNSQFILRNLLIRGLVERIDNPKDARSFLYKPTMELLSYLGVSDIKNLPEYELVRKDIENFISSQKTDSDAETAQKN